MSDSEYDHNGNEFDDVRDDAIVQSVGTLAGLIATHADVDDVRIDRHFPMLNKINPLSNINHNDEILLKKSHEILWYMKEDYTYEEFVRVRMMYIPSLSLGRDGFAVKRLTEINKSVNYNEQMNKPRSRGLFSFLKRR